MTPLSDTQRVILSKAAQHEALLATPPDKLPVAARQSVLRGLTTKGLLEEVPAPCEAPWLARSGRRAPRATPHPAPSAQRHQARGRSDPAPPR